MSEDQLLRLVLQAARLHGWRTAHFRPALTRSGKWTTAVQGDGKGFPDLVLVRGNRLIFAELKSERGTTSHEQEQWLQSLTATGVAVRVWRPSNWTDIEATLRGDA